jgi:cation diffusion facilitator family transporter
MKSNIHNPGDQMTQGAPSDRRHHHENGGLGHAPRLYPAKSTSTRLLMTLVLNFIIPSAQLAGGFWANSVALISDAVHNFSDFAAIFISYISMQISRKGASVRHTFGFQRAEIIGALLNVAILICAVIFILYEALGRLYQPEPVSGKLVILMAGVGILGNGFSAWMLHRDSKQNLNIRGAFLHMIGDFLTSVAVLIAGVVLIFQPWYWLDPVLSFLIAVFIMKNCWAVLTEAVSILMNAAPKGMDLKSVQEYLESWPEIESAHYLHAWNIGSNGIAFSCHLTVSDRMISDTEVLAEKIRHQLFHQFGIDHPVIQFETNKCGNGGILCELSDAEFRESGVLQAGPSMERHHALNLSSVLTMLIRLILGVVFIAAGAPKILYPAAFAEAVYNYQILPDELINIVAIVLPWLEVILGGMLIVGFWLPGAILMYNGLMITFIVALAYNTARGLDINCGCFSQTSTEAIGMETVFRDLLIFCLSFYLMYAVYCKKMYVKSESS